MKENKRIMGVFIAICLLFLLLAGYLSYIQLFQGDELASSTFNNRNQEQENNTLRGNIYDRNGTLLAKSKKTGEKQERIYPYKDLYSQVIGYNSKIYGKSMLEKEYDDMLLNRNMANPLISIRNALNSGEKLGNDLYLTLDHKLQVLADSLLGKKNGAVVAMNPKNGEILALVSKPDFNPNSTSLETNWQQLAESENHPFLPRATLGLYNPGSTFKTVVGAAAIENGLDGLILEDKGSVIIDGKKFKNDGGKSYGKISMTKALAISSNVYFTQLAVKLGEEKMKDIALRFGLGKGIPFDLNVSKSSFNYKSMSQADLGSTGIGQGKILVTPLHMAMIASCIANQGSMMKPILVKRVTTHDGIEIKNNKGSQYAKIIEQGIADKIKKMMQGVVEKGTGKKAAISGIHVAGKTGTAENELTGKDDSKQHVWFIGFAPVEDPQIAVAVILEYNGSTGAIAAAPIARKMMSAYLKNR